MIFDRILGRSEKNEAIEAENRQKQFMREQNALKIAESSDDNYIYAKNNDEIIKWQQDLQDELQLLIKKLKNEELVNGVWQPKKTFIGIGEGGREIWQNMRPKMNNQGLQMIESLVAPLMSRNIINSNFDEDRILTILHKTCDDLVDNLAYNFDQYDIDFPDLNIIVRLVKNVIIGAPFRALNDGERVHQRSIYKRADTYNAAKENENKKRFGIF